MRKRSRARVLGALLACAVAIPSQARADARQGLDAEALKRRADEWSVQARYADALALYEMSYELSPNAAVLYNQARALVGLGRFVEARGKLDRFKTDASLELLARVPALDLLMRDVNAGIATVRLRCNVSGATVRIRGRIVGTTPLDEVAVDAGPASLSIEKDGYFTAERTIPLPGGGASALEFALSEKKARAILSLEAAPAGSHVTIDGIARGDVPTEIDLIPGTHWIVVAREGYASRSFSEELRAGERYARRVTLDPEPGILRKWWFWTGVGVVAVGAGITVYAVTHERGLGAGDLNPGSIRSPLLRF